jgi:uncharacterized RDD family membrane protein YckC
MRDRPAGFVSRLLAFVVDLLIISGIGSVVTISVGLILNFFNLDLVVSAPTGGEGMLIQIPGPALLGAAGIFNLLLAGGYLLFFWLLAGQTPGKAFLGLRVVTTEGRPLRLGQSVRRLAGYWFSALPLFAGFLWVLIDDERRGWHDKFAGTQVVYVWEARLDRSFVRAVQERRRLLAEEEQATGSSESRDGIQ